MSNLMYFKGSMTYGNNITISLGSTAFLLYALAKSKTFVQFYKMKFYFVFALHYYAMFLNGIHGLAVQHQVVHTTLFTELCMCLLMISVSLVTIFWTYRYYLKFIYSLITRTYFQTLSSVMRKTFSCFARSKDYYNYDTINSFEGDSMEQPVLEKGTDEIYENSTFRYMNYQVLGNYLFTQVFNLYILSCTYVIRIAAMTSGMFATNQLVSVNLCVFTFIVTLAFMDFKYRRFTKSLIMPHLTLLIYLGYWMFEYYDRFDRTKPEPVSTLNFTLIFIYIVVKFSFLSDVAFLEKMDKFKSKQF